MTAVKACRSHFKSWRLNVYLYMLHIHIHMIYRKKESICRICISCISKEKYVCINIYIYVVYSYTYSLPPCLQELPVTPINPPPQAQQQPTTKQPTKQPTNQPTNQAPNQPTNQPTKQTNKQTNKQPTNQPTKQTNKQTENKAHMIAFPFKHLLPPEPKLSLVHSWYPSTTQLKKAGTVGVVGRPAGGTVGVTRPARVKWLPGASFFPFFFGGFQGSLTSGVKLTQARKPKWPKANKWGKLPWGFLISPRHPKKWSYLGPS